MEHVEAVKPHVSRQVQAMIEVQLLTAMRPGEVCRLRMREIVAKNDKQGREVWIFSPRDAENERNAARCAAPNRP
jgi:integrase